jgi:hypothetical protein
MQGPPGMMGPALCYPMNANLHPHPRPGQPQQYIPQLMNGYFPPGPHLPSSAQNQPHFPGQVVGSPGVMYSSPYAPKPNIDTAFPQNSTRSPDHHTQGPEPSPPGIPQQPQSSLLQPPQLNENISRAIDTFRTALITQLAGKSSNAEAVVASAINRVLGITTQSPVPGDPQEEKIMTALRGMLMKIPGANLQNLPNEQLSPQQLSQQRSPTVVSSQPAPIQSQTAATPSNAARPPLPATLISRPSFTGQNQNRASIAPSSVPRLPMTTLNQRTSSGSPANGPVRPGGVVFSPPIPGGVNGANLQKPSLNDNGKRQLENSDDASERNLKRLSAAGPPPLKA